jgi:hypothetical protein
MADEVFVPWPLMGFRFQFCPDERLMQKQAISTSINRDFLIMYYTFEGEVQKYSYSGIYRFRPPFPECFWKDNQRTSSKNPCPLNSV